MIYGDSFLPLNTGDAPVGILDTIVDNLRYGTPENLLRLNEAIHGLLMLMVKTSAVEKSNRAKNSKEGTNKDKIQEAVEFIRNHYWHPIHLEEVAKRFFLSKFHFLRLFKGFTGMTPYRYIIHERVNVGKKLLHTTDMKIFEISIMVGFADGGNFIRTFKAVTGSTPKAYRLSR
jgi:transcriptional regulator GlxA family with amidase domain